MEEDVRYLCDVSAESGGTGAGGMMTTEEIGVCGWDGILEEDLDGVALRGGRALVGGDGLNGEVARVGL